MPVQARRTIRQVLRSRYPAFAVGDSDYLLRSWHPSTRPKRLILDPDQQWYRLDILAAGGGGLLETEGTVEFRANYREGGQRHSLHELSRFVRERGQWLYVGPLARSRLIGMRRKGR